MKETAERNFEEHIRLASACSELALPASEAAAKIKECLKNGGKIMICGNGGSAADANHLAAEFINRYRKERESLAAISLAANTSALTATGNDYSFDRVFSRQVEGLGRKGDILIAISTSGKSANITAALKAAAKKGIFTILFTGNAETEATGAAGLCIKVPSQDTPRIQEMHLVLFHSICEMVEGPP
jgi:D-sedoheptulose 7-phosphate isomerase